MRKWRGNGERERKWRENEEMKKFTALLVNVAKILTYEEMIMKK